jgi:hypothetical protein
MINPFRRWFGGSRGSDRWAAAAEWAQRSGYRFARSSDGSGFVVEGGPADTAWRLEWGASQRHYFSGPELRLRAEVGPTGELKMLIIARELMLLLEHQVFEESTDGTETRMDESLPVEMRWLVLYPKLPRSDIGVLHQLFGALSNLPRAVQSWLDVPLSKQLEAAPSWLPEPLPLLIVVQRGRLTLRCAMPEPEVPALRGALGLFGVALAGARRVGNEIAQGSIGSGRPSTWGSTSAMPPVDAPPH